MKAHELFRVYVTEERFEELKHLDGTSGNDVKINSKVHEDDNGRKCFVESPGEGITYEFEDVFIIACRECCELRFFDLRAAQ